MHDLLCSDHLSVTATWMGADQLVQASLGKCKRDVVDRHNPESVSIVQIECAELGVAKLCSVGEHCLEHRLQFTGRRADDLEYIGSGGLLLEGFAQLIEEADVFDGNHSLVGKSLSEFDLLIGERLNYRSGEHKRADRNTVSQQRDAEIATEATQLLPFGKNIFGIG
jgi:hypothetical protein